MPNKAQFIDLLAERLDGDRKRAAAALDAVIDSVYATIARGEKVAITGFGVFERRERAARTARNPATGASVSVAASRIPAFRPGTEFKEITSGAREFTQHRTVRAQAAVTKAADTVRDAPGKAAAAVKDAQDRATSAVKDVQDRATSAVKDAADAVRSTPATRSAQKAADKARKKAKKAQQSAPAKKAAKKSAKKAASKSAPAKKSAKKAASKSAPAKKSAKKAASKSAPAKKSAKKAAKKAPAKKR